MDEFEFACDISCDWESEEREGLSVDIEPDKPVVKGIGRTSGWEIFNGKLDHYNNVQLSIDHIQRDLKDRLLKLNKALKISNESVGYYIDIVGANVRQSILHSAVLFMVNCEWGTFNEQGN